MLGLGWTEMLVIGVVALIFIGPKDLPVVMGRIGKVVGQIQRMGRDFQREINKSTGLDEVRNLRTSITSPLKKTADEIRREFNTIGSDGKEAPSGAIKPADPKVESVADEIREKAGMAPAKKTSSEMAAEYGFKPAKAEPVKASRSSTKPPTFADTETAKKAAATRAPARKPAAKRAKTAAATDEPAPAAKAPKPRAAKAAAPAKTTKPKAARKPAAKPEAAPLEIVTAGEPKPAKPRARKKPADTAGKT